MFKKILIPIDLPHESSWEKAFPTAVKLARMDGAELHVVAVVPNLGMSIVGGFFGEDFQQQARDKAKEKLKALLSEIAPDDIEVKGHVLLGTIYEEIIHAANEVDCDLIVLASHRPELKDYLLGPNAARVVRHAKQSVMVVRD